MRQFLGYVPYLCLTPSGEGGFWASSPAQPLFPLPVQNLWFANPGGSNSMPSQSRSSVQRTHSLPVHSSPQAILMFPPGEAPQPRLSWPFSTEDMSPCFLPGCASLPLFFPSLGRGGGCVSHLSPLFPASLLSPCRCYCVGLCLLLCISLEGFGRGTKVRQHTL